MAEIDPLGEVMIASPCSVGWENMAGTDRVRFCSSCRLNVYNTSQMSKKELVQLVDGGTASCLRIYRRADGTILTEDCPVGLRKIRDAASRMGQIAASFWAFVFSCTSVLAQSEGIEKANSRAEKSAPISAVDGNFYVPPDKLKGQSTVAPAATGAADTSVLKNLEKARASVAKTNNKDAERYFKLATSALAKSKHDSAFAKMVWLEYAGFLTSQSRIAEANDIRNRPDLIIRPESQFFLGEKSVLETKTTAK